MLSHQKEVNSLPPSRSFPRVTWCTLMSIWWNRWNIFLCTKHLFFSTYNIIIKPCAPWSCAFCPFYVMFPFYSYSLLLPNSFFHNCFKLYSYSCYWHHQMWLSAIRSAGSHAPYSKMVPALPCAIGSAKEGHLVYFPISGIYWRTGSTPGEYQLVIISKLNPPSPFFSITPRWINISTQVVNQVIPPHACTNSWHELKPKAVISILQDTHREYVLQTRIPLEVPIY